MKKFNRVMLAFVILEAIVIVVALLTIYFPMWPIVLAIMALVFILFMMIKFDWTFSISCNALDPDKKEDDQNGSDTL